MTLLRETVQVRQRGGEVGDELLSSCSRERLVGVDVDRQVVQRAVGTLKAGEPHRSAISARNRRKVAERVSVAGFPGVDPIGINGQQDGGIVGSGHGKATYLARVDRLLQ